MHLLLELCVVMKVNDSANYIYTLTKFVKPTDICNTKHFKYELKGRVIPLEIRIPTCIKIIDIYSC